MVDVVPVGNSKIVICHWTEGSGHWDAIEVSHGSLNGHSGHSLDVWPPVEDVTPGMNWPEGETLYLSGCVFATSPSPSPSESSTATATPSPTGTATLPPTGAGVTGGYALLGMLLLAAGVWLKWRTR